MTTLDEIAAELHADLDEMSELVPIFVVEQTQETVDRLLAVARAAEEWHREAMEHRVHIGEYGAVVDLDSHWDEKMNVVGHALAALIGEDGDEKT